MPPNSIFSLPVAASAFVPSFASIGAALKLYCSKLDVRSVVEPEAGLAFEVESANSCENGAELPLPEAVPLGCVAKETEVGSAVPRDQKLIQGT